MSSLYYHEDGDTSFADHSKCPVSSPITFISLRSVNQMGGEKRCRLAPLTINVDHSNTH